MTYNEGSYEYEDIEFLNEKTAERLAYAIKDDGNGFGGNITEFIPAPAEDNNWLYNAEAQEYSGQFMTDENLIFDFSIKKEGEDWIISTTMSHKQPTKTKMTNDIINITAYPQSGLIETYSKVGHYTPADMSYTPDAANIKTHNYDFYCTVTEPLSDLADFLLYSEIEFNGKIYYIQSMTVTNTEVKMFGALQGVSDEI